MNIGIIGIIVQQYVILKSRFEGDIEQSVPLYSAAKVNGQRLSDRIRKGIMDKPKTHRIHIDSIQLNHFSPNIFPEATLRVKCQSGTYIRSLCCDLATAMRM